MNIVITGGSKGIGKGLAFAFVEAGHKVLISGRNTSALAAISSSHPKIHSCQCDTTQPEQVDVLLARAVEHFGSIDIWINNAGLARTCWSIEATPPEEISHMINTNVLGTIDCSIKAVRFMRQQGHGKLFNMLGGGSDGEYFAGMGIYGTTKRALDYFTHALAKEMADSPVIIGKIRPGMVITEGVIREANVDPENFAKKRRFANMLADHVETVAPFLVKKMLAFNIQGGKIRWLSPAIITARLLKGLLIKPEDKFSKYGL